MHPCITARRQTCRTGEDVPRGDQNAARQGQVHVTDPFFFARRSVRGSFVAGFNP